MRTSKGAAGKPSLLKKLGCAASFQAKRTQTGDETDEECTGTFSATIVAAAGTKMPSAPATSHASSGLLSIAAKPCSAPLKLISTALPLIAAFLTTGPE